MGLRSFFKGNSGLGWFDKDLTHEDAVMQAATGGMATQAVSSRIEGRRAERAEQEAQARVAAEQARRNEHIGRIKDLFGVGTGADSATNSARISQLLDQYYRDALNVGLKGVTDSYSGASRISRQNLARAGQLGSGLDASTKSGNLAEFLRQRQGAVQQAAQRKSDLASSLAALRTNLEGQVSGGTLTNPDFTNIAQQQLGLAEQARANLVPAAVGNAFRHAGSTYYNGRVQEAQGNQGLRIFGMGGGGGGGRSSGGGRYS
jgi:hypothetical protein